MAQAGQGNGIASANEVGRVLGYTEKEQVLARDVLKGFNWRHVAQPPHPSRPQQLTPTLAQLPAGWVNARDQEDDVEAAS
jgi:hypothetical protein